MNIRRLLIFASHLLKVNHRCRDEGKRSSLSVKLREDYISYIQHPSNLFLAFCFPSKLIARHSGYSHLAFIWWRYSSTFHTNPIGVILTNTGAVMRHVGGSTSWLHLDFIAVQFSVPGIWREAQIGCDELGQLTRSLRECQL